MSTRADRVAEAIRRLTSEIVQRQLKDPRLKGMITITKVQVKPDLRLAKIFYSVLGEDKKQRLVGKGLKSAKNFIRARIGDELKLRYIPEIMLIIDKSAEHQERIDTILNKIYREEDNGENRKDKKRD